MDFRENLEFALESKGMKHVDLAKKSGISIRTLDNYFRDFKPVMPKADTAVKIAQAIGVTVEELVTGNKNKKNDDTDILFKNKDLLNYLSKLDKNHLDTITAITRNLLQLQGKK